jgi:hypothetical protein
MINGSKVSAWWPREPLVHFLAIGALLFIASSWLGDSRSGSNRIVITPGQIDSIAAAFTRTWLRPPTEQELKAQVDELVREEIAAREATVMGLDRDDTIIRRRLRQKLEFVAEDAFDTASPTDTELQTWLDAHAEQFRKEPRIAFRQVYLSPNKHGASLAVDADALREQLSSASLDVNIDTLGDSLMLPRDVELSSTSTVARLFGADFIDQVLKVEPGRSVGPVRSGYGWHIVFVGERQDGAMPELAEVRPQVERLFTSERRQRQLQAMYTRLLDHYQVTIETRVGDPRAVDAPSPKDQEPRN